MNCLLLNLKIANYLLSFLFIWGGIVEHTRAKNNIHMIAAQALDQLYNMAKTNVSQSNKSTLSKLRYKIKRSSVFRSYKSLPTTITRFYLNKPNIKYLRDCLQIKSKKNHDNTVIRLFYTRIGLHCAKKSINQLDRGKGKTNTIYTNVFIENITQFLNKGEASFLVSRISKLNKKSPTRLAISEALKKHYLNTKTPPKLAFLPIIGHDPQFTNFIQTKGLLDKYNTRYLHREFNIFNRNIKKNYMNNNHAEVRTTARHILDFYKANRDYMSHKRPGLK